MTRKRLQIQGMHCIGCAMTVDNALEDLPGVKAATTNYARQVADVEYDESKVTEAQIIKAVQNVGYSCSIEA